MEIQAKDPFVTSLNHLNAWRVALEIFGSSCLLSLLAYFGMYMLNKRRQEAVEHSRLAAIVESSTDAIIGKDLNGVINSWNKAAETIFGFTADEAIGRKLGELIVPEDLLYEEDEFLAAIRRGDSVPNRITFRRRKNGELIHAAVSISPIFDRQGRVAGAAKMLRDMTKEIRMDGRFQLAVESAGIGVWVWHLETNTLQWDHRMRELYAVPQSLGESGHLYDFWRNRVHPDDIGFTEEKLQQLLKGEGPYDPIFRIVREDGCVRWIQGSAHVERDFKGQPMQMVGTNIDITEHVEATTRLAELKDNLEDQVAIRTEELKLAVAEARRANEAKSAFLANMSHEIRTPMNGVLGLAYLLSKADLPQEAALLVRKLQTSGKTLQRILDDILDYSKLEAAGMVLEMAPFDLQDVINNVSVMMEASSASKNIELAITPPKIDDTWFVGDQVRLSQVLMNLVVNAVKFTDRGYVIVRMSCVEDDAQGATIHFEVEDSGIGMTEEQMAKLFLPFQQADVSTTRKFGGTGLGLTISKRLLELMGSQLQVKSTMGRGSTFHFTLKLARASADSHDGTGQRAPLNVLIADDSELSRQALRATVESLGWQADVVNDALSAIWRPPSDPKAKIEEQVFILDWKMPEIDGLEAAQLIHEHMGGHQGPIIVLATAYSREELLSNPRVRFTDAVLTKPVTASALYDAVGRAQQRRKGIQAAIQSSGQQRLAGLRLLVVDDSEINREVALRIFEGEGAKVTLASDGQQAFEWLQAHPKDVDMVLMDIQMPILDGYGAMALIKQEPALSRIPVVALTAGVLDTARNAVFASGMVGLIPKPMETNGAIQTIRQVVAQFNIRALPFATPDSQAEAPIVPDVGVWQGLDVRESLVLWGSETRYRQYLSQFVSQHQSTKQVLSSASKEELRPLAHTLCGVSGNVGLTLVCSEARAVEQAIDRGEDYAVPLAKLIAALEQGLSVAQKYLATTPQVA